MNIDKLLRRHLGWLAALAWISAQNPAPAQETVLTKEAYLSPPKVLADAVMAAAQRRTVLTNLSPDGQKFLVARSEGMPSLEMMARPYVHLSERMFDPVARCDRSLWVRSLAGYELFYYRDKRTVQVEVPPAARVCNAAWSPDGSKLAFLALFEDATRVYIADTVSGKSRPLSDQPVVATLDTSFQWSKDGAQIQAVLVPEAGEQAVPKPSRVATEPSSEERATLGPPREDHQP